MTIDEIIADAGVEYLLNPRPFTPLKPHRGELFEQELKFISENNPKMYIVPDTDVDGILATKIMYDTVITVSDTVPTVHIFDEKSHGITMAMAYEIIKNGYTYVIILDSSTNNMKELQLLASRGIRVLLIDHHKSDFELADYPAGVQIFSSEIDISSGIKIPYSEASCGLLVALYCNFGLHSFGYKMPDLCWLYASITLYSDAMNTLNPFNVMIINYTRNYTKLDNIMSKISGRSDKNPTRNIITFSINPKINTCLRIGRMDLIYRLFFLDITAEEESAICEEINDINSSVKEQLREVESTLLFYDIMSVTLVDLNEYLNTNIISFKGYLANKISEQTGNTCIAYYVIDGVVHGSVRDSLGRDVYTIFRDFCEAGGHPSALGFEIKESYLVELAKYVSFSLQDVAVDLLKPIVLDMEQIQITQEEIKKMSIVNEYTTTNTIGLKIKLDPYKTTITSYKNMYTIKTRELTIRSSIPVNYGDTVLVVPTYGTQVELRLKSRCG